MIGDALTIAFWVVIWGAFALAVIACLLGLVKVIQHRKENR